jgi:transposase-like protein
MFGRRGMKGLLKVRLSPDLWGAGALAGRMSIVPRPYPTEFRADVVAVARRGNAPISQVAKDFGITESCLCNWLHAADVVDSSACGSTKSTSDESTRRTTPRQT